ncbi:MAG: type IX secretion system membrane protein PorP/SprF [Chitinophagaceae bacterium]|nr:type IX secretion system membrane protein PorP/SprF [Chitinophagaceae bacterium]
MKRILIVIFIALAGRLFAQQDPLFSQFMFNKMAVNPAYAGN